MYSRPTVYKIYSIVSAIFAIYTFIQCIINAFILPVGLFSNIQAVANLLTTTKIIMIVFAVINLFFAYMDFSSFYCFSKLVDYDLQSKEQGTVLPGFILPPNVYKMYGKILYWLSVICFLLSIIVSIAIGVSTGVFIALPLTILISGIGIPLLYFTIYTRYTKIAELMASLNENKKIIYEKNASNYTIYRQFSHLFYVLTVISIIIGVVSLIVLCLSPAIVMLPVGQIVLVILSIIVSMFTGFLSNLTLASFYSYLSKKSVSEN